MDRGRDSLAPSRFDPAAAVGPEASRGVGFIHDQMRLISSRKIQHFRQRRAVAVHTEKRFGDDKELAIGCRLSRCRAQTVLQMIQVLMPENETLRLGQT